jgi:hypothetical protein
MLILRANFGQNCHRYPSGTGKIKSIAFITAGCFYDIDLGDILIDLEKIFMGFRIRESS